MVEFADIAGNIDNQFEGVLENIINGELERVYNNSPRFREILNQLVDSEGNPLGDPLRIEQTTGNNQALVFTDGTGGRVIEINPELSNNLLYINANGEVFAPTLTDIIIHEIVHAITGSVDPDTSNSFETGIYSTPFGDYLGETERESQEIYDELGVPSSRCPSSYKMALISAWAKRDFAHLFG